MRISLLTAGLVLAMGVVCAKADTEAQAKQTFNELFGKEVQRVNGTPDAADDVELAGQLLDAARTAEDKPAMQSLLCDYAFSLGSRDISGYPVAVEAMQLLGQSQPKEADQANKRIAALYQRGYERSIGDKKVEAGELYLDFLLKDVEAQKQARRYDEVLQSLRKAKSVALVIKSPLKDKIDAQLQWYGPLAIARQRIDITERKLESNPWDKTTRMQLVQLYLVDMDDPAEASKHVKLGGDDAQKKLVPLAAKPMAEVAADEAYELAEWYEKQGATGSPAARHAMLARSQGYYDRFLELHSEQDVRRAAVALAQKRVTDALAAIGTPDAVAVSSTAVTQAAGGKTFDLLAKVDPNRDRIMGQWSRDPQALRGEESGNRFGWGLGVLRTPYSITGDYDLEVKFLRESTEGSFGIIIPVADDTVSFVMDDRNSGKSGLSEIDGKDARENDTTIDLGIRTRRAYKINIAVRTKDADDGGKTASIVVKVDGQKVIDWTGKASALSLFGGIRYGGDKAVGFLSNRSVVAVGSAKLTLASSDGQATELTNQPFQFGGNDDPNETDEDRRRRFEEMFRNGRFPRRPND